MYHEHVIALNGCSLVAGLFSLQCFSVIFRKWRLTMRSHDQDKKFDFLFGHDTVATLHSMILKVAKCRVPCFYLLVSSVLSFMLLLFHKFIFNRFSGIHKCITLELNSLVNFFIYSKRLLCYSSLMNMMGISLIQNSFRIQWQRWYPEAEYIFVCDYW